MPSRTRIRDDRRCPGRPSELAARRRCEEPETAQAAVAVRARRRAHDRVLEQVRAAVDAGIDHVYLRQVEPDQAGFLEFAERELLPRARELNGARRRAA